MIRAVIAGYPPAARRVMLHKRARVPAELAAEVRAEMSDATNEEREAEAAQRADQLKQRGMLMEQWDLDRIGADLERCGLSGSPTKVYRVQGIVLTFALMFALVNLAVDLLYAVLDPRVRLE